jgi:hypothetical protein
MTPEKELQLMADFPQIFTDATKGPKESAMSWGIECESGWYDLLHDMCQEVMDMIAATPDLFLYEFRAEQVKEKFGTLRFYSNSTTILQNIVDRYERLSGSTCEMCGKPGILHHSGSWLKTLCFKCAKANNYIVDDYKEVKT